MSNEKDPELQRNYWLAMGLSFLVLMGYPLLMKYFHKPVVPEKTALTQSEDAAEAESQTSELIPSSRASIELPPPAETVRRQSDSFELEFSELGASLTYLLFKGEPGREAVTRSLLYEAKDLGPGIFQIQIPQEQMREAVSHYRLLPEESAENSVSFLHERENDLRIKKIYTIENQNEAIELDLEITNLSSLERHIPLELQTAIQYEITQNVTPHNIEFVASHEKIETADLGKAKKGFTLSHEMKWAGLMKKYFALLVRPDRKILQAETTADHENIFTKLRLEPLVLGPGAQARVHFLIFAGPKRLESLEALDAGFEELLYRGIFGPIKALFLKALKFCYRYTHNFGWAILLITLLLKLIFTPFTHMGYESMKRMQAIQPKLKSLQQRYKNDPLKLQQESAQLFKRNRVNPMGGCLPMVMQVPIFIAFYQVLSEAIELKGAPFIAWIHDLSAPDRFITLPFSIPVLGDGFNILPMLMAVSMFWQQKLTPQASATPEQAQVMTFMPVIMGVMMYSLPSGLVLYWFVSNVLTIIHQIFIKRIVVQLHHEDQE